MNNAQALRTRRQALQGLARGFTGGALLSGFVLASLTGCGFQLRQSGNLPFQSLFLNLPRQSALGNDLLKNLASQTNLKVFTEAKDLASSQVVLEVLSEVRERVVVGLNASGQVRELQLRLKVKFRLRTPQGKNLISEVELQQQRDLSFLESAALSKEIEEAMMYRDMQVDIVQQILRRLAAVKSL
ncbi:MAG: LPS assembly lipoprotein LptE [Comamonadaceae bacterium]|nr:LPS assembly lipoprotein LptE [Comamonadaceae bacterium]